MSDKKVFISYSHDSDEHREKVLAFSERLRQDGIETLLDQYVNGAPEQGWPRWMLDQFDAADFVLVICTETYYRRFRGHEVPGKGKGVDWEGAIITQQIYDARSRTLKFVPVFLSAAVEAWIPDPLRSPTHYALTSESDYQRLYDFLLEQAGVEPHPVGTLKPKPRRKGTPMTFGESPTSEAAKIDISRIDKYAPAELIGRQVETQLLSDAWAKVQSGETPRPHVLTIVALGGEGKTALVAKWAAELAAGDWPGCDAAFAWSFYSQGTRDQAAASSDLFLKAALTFFGDSDMADSAAGAFEKGQRLATLVGDRQALLILDGIEPLQYAPNSPTPGELKDQGLAALLKGLAANSHGLCVVTTRYGIPDLRAYIGKTVQEKELQRLSKEAGVALLKKLGVKGTQTEFETLVEDVKGHALTLNLLGTFLRDAHGGDIRKRDLIKLEEADAVEQSGHAFHVMDAYVKWFKTGGKTAEENQKGQRALAMLWLMGLFDRPATADCLNALWKGRAVPRLTEPLIGISNPQRNMILSHLEDAKLITVNRNPAGNLLALDAHQFIREYFARQLRKHQPKAWRDAHRRLYEHLCASTTDKKPQPSLEDLQPLYQAVAHGCQAGLQQEVCDKVFRKRILRGTKSDGFYSTKKLGAFGSDLGAVACFFETPWSRVSPKITEADQAWLLAMAAFTLHAMGRLTDALEPQQISGEMDIKQKDWKNAATSAENLSGLNLTLGQITSAVAVAERGVIYADSSGDATTRMMIRTTHAHILHESGNRTKAEAVFHQAEQIQKKDQPTYPLLYSVQGFWYCDLLLSQAERAAWQCHLNIQYPISNIKFEESCRAVEKRAAQTLKWAELGGQGSLLSIALDPLTLGRVAIYQSILENNNIENRKSEIENIESAMSGLRHANHSDYLPLGLLTRAWLRRLTGPLTGPESTQTDLDEAWEIAERGPMPLYMADIHLHRARLFFREVKYPWESPQKDLAEARRLIFKHGYLRRKEELEDAEGAILDKKKN